MSNTLFDHKSQGHPVPGTARGDKQTPGHCDLWNTGDNYTSRPVQILAQIPNKVHKKRRRRRRRRRRQGRRIIIIIRLESPKGAGDGTNRVQNPPFQKKEEFLSLAI